MKRLLSLLSFLLALSVFAAAQSTNVPTCNGFANGVPIDTASGSSVCTDYFGVGNWANSPLPAGTITGYTLISAGSGYVNPQVVIMDITGIGATATATLDTSGSGAITGITAGSTGNAAYTMPMVSVVDVGAGGVLGGPTCGGTGPVCGSGAMATAIIGPPFTGGMLKFQDALPDLKTALATPDTTTFPGSDFYVIGLVEYKAQMHASLPPTTLRGYCQIINGACGTQSYLGPVIVAQKNRPVRVLFRNLLPTGAGGNLFIPMDSTYMGANLPQNRGTLHLHGGVTPWISDGTPHQWTTPENDTLMTGPSTQPVPDMYFSGGSIVPFCNATLTSNCYPNGTFTGTLPPGATTTPPGGDMTFYWTNQQGGRLMFYHDHAYGITRLNVYVGEAAGYLLYDPVEETTLANAGMPGSVTAGDLTHLIPLVIQDKTFVTPAQIPVQDPTWLPFGTSPGTPTLGDLWFPHVYIPNQNPNDPLGAANGFGRWDYGAWFFPPMTSLTGSTGAPGPVTMTCTSAAFPGQTLQPVAPNNNQGCPIIPNPSGTPEGFMDTPIVNGKAYPVLHIAPEAYRFKILSAGNDRSWNLSWFIADPSPTSPVPNSEVAMLPAVPPSAGSVVPLCSQINPVAVPMLGIGLATGLLDGTGNPLNGTGLPKGTSGCWPNYGPLPGIPSPQTMWAADGRAGGAPDPRNAGPAWVQIGSEGGLLPAPVVIPPTPINYEQNTRSITITSVAVHGLWLGPAERADVLVDFSQFAGKTLILYNDAPTPAPAFDSRLDYFTGDGDQTPIGGAPNTPAGYGPNTRTIMQVKVDLPTAGGHALSVLTLKAAFASTATAAGLFASTQPTTIVPEPNYNSAYNASFPPKYSGIGDNSMTFTPIAPLNFESLLGTAEPSACTGIITTPPSQCGTFNHKAIQELFTLDYGRMNATLGTELPNVNFTNQTTIPLAYVDPATEIIRQGDTQLWKITHNGVDSHFIHFHLFNVQVINRVGWDGSLRPPDANEMGWKDTVRMNPLEDVLVALQPVTPQLPWPIQNSVRHNDVMTGMNMFTNVDPFTNGGAPTLDGPTNFGWEYVWHCHILGHEENDMMRPIMYQVPPPTPSNLLAAGTNGGVMLTWIDNSASETGFVVERDTDPAFPAPAIINAPASLTTNAVGEGTDWGGLQTVTDAAALVSGTTYYYRVQAVDDGFKSPFEQSYNNTSKLLSAWSNLATIQPVPIAGISPTSLAFGNVTVNTSTQMLANGQLAQVTISNTGNAVLTLTSTQTGSADFTSTASACGNVTPGVPCVFGVTYAPTVVGAASATITFTTNDPAHPTLIVSVTGSGIVTTAITISAPTVTYNANAIVTLTVTATPSGFTPTGNVTLTVDSGTPISQDLTAGLSAFTIVAPNAGTHTLLATYATQGGFQGSTASGSLIVNKQPLTISPTPNPASMIYGGLVPTLTPTYNGFVVGQGPSNLTGTATCSTTATAASLVGAYTSVCAGATSTNYSITYPPGVVNVTQASTATTILTNTPSPAIIGQIVTVSFKVAPQFTGVPTGTVKVTASTGETCTSALTAGVGSCTLTFATGGNRTLTAVYSGDGNFVTSTSAPATQVVSNISLSTFSLLFGNQLVGTRSAQQQVTISNVGTTTLTITGMNWSAGFSDSSNCGPSLAAGRSCRINVAFVPTTVGVITGTLTITDSDATSPQIVTLTGTGITAPAMTPNPASLTFPATRVGVPSSPLPVTITSSGGSNLILSGITIGGGNPGDFAQTNNCPIGGIGLAPGASCTVNVTFTPTRRNQRSSSLRVADNAPGSPQSVPLSGTGQ